MPRSEERRVRGADDAFDLLLERHVVYFHGVCIFFQAEHGIRDAEVIGVQTCALPISCTDSPWPLASVTLISWNFPSGFRSLGRSEERRVGKECRSRWSPYH